MGNETMERKVKLEIRDMAKQYGNGDGVAMST